MILKGLSIHTRTRIDAIVGGFALRAVVGSSRCRRRRRRNARTSRGGRRRRRQVRVSGLRWRLRATRVQRKQDIVRVA